MSANDETQQQIMERMCEVARDERAPLHLGERVAEHVAYRQRLEGADRSLRRSRGQYLGAGALAVGAAVAATWVLRGPNPDQAIAPERPAGSASNFAPRSPPAQRPLVDPCLERSRADGRQPLIDDFEDGDDALLAQEARAGFWRWAREIDAPGTAPALIPVPRGDRALRNGAPNLALHAKGDLLVDWGATVEVTFRPACYDASKYAGISFQARGPGRIYLAPRQVSVIPVAEGGLCESDCHNPHVSKVELDGQWQSYQVRWEQTRQRGKGKLSLDPTRLNSIAFLIRPEDTPYDVWIDEVRFIAR